LCNCRVLLDCAVGTSVSLAKISAALASSASCSSKVQDAMGAGDQALLFLVRWSSSGAPHTPYGLTHIGVPGPVRSQCYLNNRA